MKACFTQREKSGFLSIKHVGKTFRESMLFQTESLSFAVLIAHIFQLLCRFAKYK